MRCISCTKRKLWWSSFALLAVSVTILSNVAILARLFLSTYKQRLNAVSPAHGFYHLRFAQNFHTDIQKPSTTHTLEFLATSVTRSVTDARPTYRSHDEIHEAEGYFSNQTLPSYLREGLLKPGTKEEAIARKLMSVRRHKIVNSHHYGYRINPLHVCANKVVEIVLCVVSAVKNVNFRHRFRYAIKSGYAGIWNEINQVVLLFFLGLPTGDDSQSLQEMVNNESLVYGDIVQGTYLDTYRNLSIKTVSILKWVSTYCSNANFVIKTDDDCDVNIPLMITELHKKQQEVPLFILGKVSRKLTPVRIAKSKWYIPRSLYGEDKFPTFMYGGSQGYPTAVAKLLYEASLRIPLFWLEDVYISGICASMLNIPRFDSPAFYFSHFPPPSETEY
ncbi:unnamed protein product [Candidula unifasciata]|uniref:Hexosyltransferase n=1 Tax=Candidula unifasciata TaxID=100452 RepID=A0A8S3Z7S6_9EUPU|nr:unnamed protein product [Candidula unifasciata]